MLGNREDCSQISKICQRLYELANVERCIATYSSSSLHVNTLSHCSITKDVDISAHIGNAVSAFLK